jgi:dienelactone hydrolase
MRRRPFRYATVMRITVNMVLGIAALVAATAALTAWESRRPRTLPQPSGRYEVGRRFFSWRDAARLDPLSPVRDARREVAAFIWYPAYKPQSGTHAPYAPDEWIAASAHDWTTQRLDRVQTHAYENAVLATANTSFPVLIFSPGSGQLPISYTALSEELASHGYVVVALAHPFSTPIVHFPDGRTVRAAASRYNGGLGEYLASIWAADIVSTLNFLHVMQQAGDAFFAPLALQQVGVLGHSFGGAAAVEACRIDPRFSACMNLDGTVYGPATSTGLKQPLFLLVEQLRPPPKLWAARRQNFEANQAREDGLFEHSCTSFRLTVPKLLHMNISDQAFFFEAGDKFMEVIGSRLDGHSTLPIVSSAIRAFFDRYATHSSSGELNPENLRGGRIEVHKGCRDLPSANAKKL